MFTLTVHVLCQLAILTSVKGYNTELLGKISVNNPGFLSIIQTKETGHATNDYDLFVSSFNGAPFTVDHVFHIPAIGNVIKTLKTGSRVHLNTIASDIPWPNEVNQVPGQYNLSNINLISIKSTRMLKHSLLT